jgi:hypothetical protein
MARRRLSKTLDLELAWKRVKSDQYDDLVPDILELRDVDHDKKTVINGIRQALDNAYAASDLLSIDVPKKGYTLRPCCYMTPEDRIVYQAAADYISQHVQEPPSSCVFSHRLNPRLNSKSMFKFWKNEWLKWRKEMRGVYNDGKGRYCCLLRTDIAAYFEQIDYDILRTAILDKQVRDTRILDLLRNMLKKWAVSKARHIGIPQGCDASSYLGNLYLTNLDKHMVRHGFKYYRYSDEIYIFVEDEPKARKAIKAMTEILRGLHLNLQEAKTDIITDHLTIVKEIGNDDEDKKKDFDYEFTRKRKKGRLEQIDKAEVAQRYRKVTGAGKAKKVDASDFKWCLTKLRTLRDARAARFILKRLGDMAFLANSFSHYLQIFANRKDVKTKIVNFLNSPNNIYEWEEMWLLLALSKAKKLDSVHLDTVRKIVEDTSRHWAPRAAAILVLGQLGDETDRQWLADLYTKEYNMYIRRAIPTSVHSLSLPARNAFYSRIASDSKATGRLVKYLKLEQIQTI